MKKIRNNKTRINRIYIYLKTLIKSSKYDHLLILKMFRGKIKKIYIYTNNIKIKNENQLFQHSTYIHRSKLFTSLINVVYYHYKITFQRYTLYKNSDELRLFFYSQLNEDD